VLLLERGPLLDGWASKVPLFSAAFDSGGGRAQRTDSLPNTQLDNRSLPCFRGSVLGGTSRINQMLYIRGFPGEYDEWEANGARGWSFDSLKPLFKKSEGAQETNASDDHGKSGPWKTRVQGNFFFPATSKIIAVAEDLGIPFAGDINSSTAPSTFCAPVRRTVDPQGRRSSTYHAFLTPQVLKERSNRLDIRTSALVTKINFIESAGSIRASAIKVRLLTGSAEKTVTARKEIVLSAGSLSTPQILMLSGIGPRAHLENFGIKVIKDLPGVGEHLQDHFSVALRYFVPMSHSLLRIESFSGFLKEMFSYIVYGSGMLLNPLPEILIFANSHLLDEKTGKYSGTPVQTDTKNPENLPDIGIEPIAYDAIGGDYDKSRGRFSFLATLARPTSVGSVRLRSTDPSDEPLVDLDFFSTEDDKVVMRKAIKLVLKLVEGLRERGYDIEDDLVPASNCDEDLDAHTRQWGRTIYHYSSTCRMGTVTGAIPAVVDEQLRVHGIEGLRIADTSILPRSPAAYLQALAVVVAEKCAQMITSSVQE